MRIVHLTNYLMEKLGYQDSELPLKQYMQGNEVKIITSDRYYPFSNYDSIYKEMLGDRIQNANSYSYLGCNITRLVPFLERASSGILLLPFFKTYGAIVAAKPDVIHVHGELNFNLITAIVYSLFNHVKLYIDCHADQHNFKSISSFRVRLLIFFFKIIHRIFKTKINGYLPITQASLEYLKSVFKIDADRLSLLPLGGSGPASKGKAPGKHLRFIYSGKISPEKGVKESLDILRILAFKLTKRVIHFDIVGGFTDSTFEKYIRHLSADYNSSNFHIKIHDFMSSEDLAKMHHRSDFGMWLGSASNSIQDCFLTGSIVFLSSSSVTEHLTLDGKLVLDSKEVFRSADILYEYIHDEETLVGLYSESFNMISRYTWDNIAIASIQIYGQNNA